MSALNDTLHYLFEVLKVTLTGDLALRQPEVIEEAIICRGTHSQPHLLLIVHLYCVAEEMGRRVPKSILIEGYSLNFARFLQWSVVEIEQDR